MSKKDSEYIPIDIEYLELPSYQLMVKEMITNNSRYIYKPLDRNYGFRYGKPILKEYYKYLNFEDNTFIPEHNLMRNILFSGQAHYILILATELSQEEYEKRFCKKTDQNLFYYDYNKVFCRNLLFFIDLLTGKPVTDFLQYSSSSHKFNHNLLDFYDTESHILSLKTPYVFKGL